MKEYIVFQRSPEQEVEAVAIEEYTISQFPQPMVNFAVLKASSEREAKWKAPAMIEVK